MLTRTATESLRVPGIILRRTNYGEADRILNIITPKGKITAIAKGVRREKSKLAGGVELFSLVDLNLHLGRSEFAIVTGAKMTKYYSEVLKDFERMELAALVLKQINRAAEYSDASEFFEITRQCLEEINDGMERPLVESWFWLNLKRVGGEEMNLYRDEKGEKLMAQKRYSWNALESVLTEDAQGECSENEIKMLRLLTTAKLNLVRRVRVEPEVVNRIYGIIKTWVN